MKKCRVLFVVMILVISLLGCSRQDGVYTVTVNGTDFFVDPVEMTVTEGENVYRYSFSGDSSDYRVTIQFPDGSSYWYSQSDGSGIGGWSEDYREDNYVSGDTLVNMITQKAPNKANSGRILGGILLVALGVFDLVFPRVSWYLGYGWRYKNAEPSDAALIFARIAGGIVAVLGIVLFVS